LFASGMTKLNPSRHGCLRSNLRTRKQRAILARIFLTGDQLMKFLWLVLISICGLALIACNKEQPVSNVPQPTQSAAAPSPTPDEFAAVRATYAKECAVCHGDKGEGKTVEVQGKKIKAPSLRTGHALKHSDKDFVAQIRDGGDGMPAFEKKMTPQEITEMVKFIRKEFQGK
jgi:mono/diheme cytochrome c family protein